MTAALFDMFCGLNGRTLKPRRTKARHSPATSSDLPTLEPVPCNIKARGSIKALAKELGVSFPTINRWENGKAKPSQLSWAQLLTLVEEVLARR
ncbi:hypothetical protein WCLP8_590003 [uncultured Gammaproteobacteria bacterium]